MLESVNISSVVEDVPHARVNIRPSRGRQFRDSPLFKLFEQGFNKEGQGYRIELSSDSIKHSTERQEIQRELTRVTQILNRRIPDRKQHVSWRTYNHPGVVYISIVRKYS